MELLVIISAIALKYILPLPNGVTALLAAIYVIVASVFVPTALGTGMWLMATVFYAPAIFIALWIIYAILDLMRNAIKWVREKYA